MKRYIFAISLLCGLLCCSCDDDFQYYTLAIQNTSSVATSTSATVTADIVYKDKNGRVQTSISDYADGVPTIEYYGVYYSTTNSNPGKGDKKVMIENSKGYNGYEKLKKVEVDLTGLTKNTSYYARVFVCNNYGEETGNVIEFTTKGSVTVKTNSATNITTSSATLNGNITKGSGSVNMTKRGFVLSTTNNPTITSCLKKWDQSSSVAGDYSTSMTGLSASTNYYYRAYAVVDGNPVYGGSVSFTTSSAQDAITIVTNDPTNVTSTSATVGGTINIGTDAKGTISEIGIMYVPTTEATFGKLKTWTGSTISSWTGSHTFTATLNFGSYDSYYYFAYYIKGGETYGTTSKIVTRSGGGGGSGTSLTIAQFKSQPDDLDTWYDLTGVIYYIDNTTYGNFYLADETGLLPVYGLTSTKRTSNDKSFSSLGLKEGDYITISAPKTTYGGHVEAQCGYLVEKKEKLTYETNPFNTFNLEPTTTTTIQMTEPTSIYVSIYEYYISYDFTLATLCLHFTNGQDLWMNVDFFGKKDPEIVIPEGTYPVTETMMGSVWGTNGVSKNTVGYTAYLNFDDFPKYLYNQTNFGYRCPYYITGGSMTVTKSGTKANLNINFTTYFGSTIKGNFTLDLLGELSSAPSAVEEKEMILQRQVRK